MKRKGNLGGIFAMALILVLTLVLSVGSVSAAEPTIVDSGNCGANGDNITWTLDDAGTLTISGTGEMGKFQYSEGYPWLSRRDEIKTVRIEDGVTNIGGGAFDNGVPITTVSIPDSVTAIGEFAFSNCINLKSLTIPDSVTDIGVRAFYKCWGLTAMEIPKSVTKIHNRAFDSCSGLTGIQVADENPNYASMDGVLFDKGFAALLACPGGKKGSYRIPDGVTSIEESAFYGCGGLTSVTIPEGVTSIEPSTFANCVGLTSVMIPEGIVSIGRCAFSDCSSLTAVVIPEGVTDIGRAAFSRCTSLKSVKNPKGITSIGSEAFWGCSKLTSVTIPDSVTSIGFSAFSSCTSLRTMRIPKNVAAIEKGTFYGCTGLTSVTILEGVTKIGESAFSGCSGLTAVKIPGSVVSIGKSAFDGCSSLTSVTISEGTASIGDSAFNECRNLTSVAIPDSVTSIGKYVFGDCRSLISATIPEGVTEIKRGTFYWCTSLTSVSIPDSVTSIGEDAFYSCTGLKALTIPDGVTNIGDRAFGLCSNLTSVMIGNSVTSIGTWVFSACGKLSDITVASGNPSYMSYDGALLNRSGKELIFCPQGKKGSYQIPDGVTLIKYEAFFGCRKLTSVTIPEGVVKIERYAFRACEGLTDLLIPSTVSSIEHGVFWSCTGLTDIFVASGNPNYMSKDGVLINKSEKKLIHCPEAKTGDYQIPDGVIFINDYAFCGCEKLTSVTIPESVTDIGESAFSGCTGLTSVMIPSSVRSISMFAFCGCTGLTSVVISNGVTSIGQFAFSGCTGLTSVTIPEGVTSIEWSTFNGCSGLTSITIPGSVTSIGGSAFDGCSSLTDVYFSGTKTQWESIAVGEGNDPLQNAEIHYQLAAPTAKPSYVGASGKPYIYWGAVDGANRYYVYRSTTKDGTYTLLSTTTATNYTDNKANAGYTYYYKVKAVAADGTKSNYSVAVAGVCHCARPTVTPDYLTSTGKPYLKWAAVAGASKYEVYRSGSKDGTYTPLGTTTNLNYTDNKANAGYTYYYKVKAVSKVKTAANSYYSIAVAGICHCARPTVTPDYLTSTGKPYIKWTAVAGAGKYEVYRSGSKDGTYTLLGTTTATNYTDNKANAGYTYYYKVKAVSKVSSGANSYYSAAIGATCHCARPSVKITTSNGSPKLTWNAVAGASQYEVYRATSKNGTYTKMFTTSNLSYTNTSAVAGTTYYYKVKAVSKVKSTANSAFSTVVSIRAR